MSSYARVIIAVYENSPNLLCMLSAIFVLSIDLITGEDIHFPIFFAFPVGLAAWQLNRIMAYSLSISLPLLRVGFFYLWNDNQLGAISMINAFINVVALAVFVYLTARFVFEKRELQKRLAQLEDQLSGSASGEV